MSITVKGQATVQRGALVSNKSYSVISGGISKSYNQYSISTNKEVAANSAINTQTQTVVAPANAIGQNADKSYIFAPAPSNAIGQNENGSYILSPTTGTKISSTSSNTNGLPNISSFDLIRGLTSGINVLEKNVTQGLVYSYNAAEKYNQTEIKSFSNEYSPSPTNIISGASSLVENAGTIAGNTAANIIKPIAIPLLLGIAVYAFTSR